VCGRGFINVTWTAHNVTLEVNKKSRLGYWNQIVVQRIRILKHKQSEQIYIRRCFVSFTQPPIWWQTATIAHILARRCGTCKEWPCLPDSFAIAWRIATEPSTIAHVPSSVPSIWEEAIPKSRKEHVDRNLQRFGFEHRWIALHCPSDVNGPRIARVEEDSPRPCLRPSFSIVGVGPSLDDFLDWDVCWTLRSCGGGRPHAWKRWFLVWKPKVTLGFWVSKETTHPCWQPCFHRPIDSC
jgi:hypothetical protein